MSTSEWPVRRFVVFSLIGIALVYAFFAGLRTIGDFDFGWQIATGRYVAQHHHIPGADALAYTVPGRPWLYPPFSGLILYWLYLLGGYAALSWLLAIAVVATVGFLVRVPSVVTALAAILAVPSLVFRETPRAELFTTFLFAVYLSLLWRYFRDGEQKLWPLPLFMLWWVNLHPGFISGLAALAGYVFLEVCELPFAQRAPAAKRRLRKAAPWLAGAVSVTLLNAFGPRIYIDVARTNRAVKELGDFIGEWSRPNLSPSIFHQMLRFRDPESSFWWLLALALIAAVTAMRRKQIGAAIFLLGASFFALQYLRFQGLFACVAVIVGGAVLDEIGFLSGYAPKNDRPRLAIVRTVRAATLVVCIALACLTGLRSTDLVTNRHYIEAGEVVLFGPGEASWFPERAAQFVEAQRLPGNLFNDYNLGGFLEWRLPEYKAYVDSRAIPFGVELLNHQRILLKTPLDSAQWAEEADRRDINFVFVSLDRYTGLGKVPLQEDCRSRTWRPIYLDETAAIFLRNTPQNAALIRQFGIDCATAPFTEPDAAKGPSYRARGIAYNFFANAGAVSYLLGRDVEARRYLTQAAAIEPHDSNLHLTLAQLYQADNQLEEAEREYKASIAQRPTDFAWYLLGVLYGKQQRYPEAIAAMQHSADISYDPANRYRVIGQIQNVMQQPKDALKAFAHAEKIGSHGSIEDQKLFRAQLAAGRARSWELLHDLNRAIAEQRKSVELQPDDPNRWTTLANLYREQGNAEAAAQAQAKADALRATSQNHLR
jgi:tetratricopeptide (TPR) repeat protein